MLTKSWCPDLEVDCFDGESAKNMQKMTRSKHKWDGHFIKKNG